MPAGPVLVQNTIIESVLGSSTVRLTMDFGNVAEILAGDLIASCAITTVSISGVGTAVTVSSIVVTSGFLVSGLFTGGAAGNYLVTFTPTLVSGQVLPSRTGQLTLQ